MRLKISARHSDLARLQAQTVGQALQKANPDLEIDFHFRASLGDLNLNDPLWKMPEKGVFTEDFLADLIKGETDMVVHSWKDLPTEPRPQTEIVATLPREDVRDLFLFRRDRFAQAVNTKTLKVLTSSPRRAHNLREFFQDYLPFAVEKIEFENVRGNIPTRLRKLLSQDVDGLILAKAALDRLLAAESDEYRGVQEEIRSILEQCAFMVLPLSINPTAAAQGALAVEIRKDRSDLRDVLAQIHSSETFSAVKKEREILSSYGGGCHQKIGINLLPRPYGTLQFLRGLTDGDVVLDSVSLQTSGEDFFAQSENETFPPQEGESLFFDREDLSIPQPPSAQYLWVARENALPRTWKIDFADKKKFVIWTAGLKTWQKLAKRGLWVHGSAEGLGETEPARIETLLNVAQIPWTKLSHLGGLESKGMSLCATYKLIPKEKAPDLKGKTHFFWMSGSSFDRALDLYPFIRDCHHASGPGSTHEHLRKRLGPQGKVRVYLNLEHWRSQILTKSAKTARPK